MAGRIYTATSALVTYTATAATPVFYALTPATSTADILAIRVGVYSGAASPSYPTNGTLLAQLVRATGTRAGGTSITPAPHNASDIASQLSQCYDASGSAITGLSAGVTLWEQALPFTAGANWAEWFSPGTEPRIAASAAVAVYLTANSAGTSTQVEVQVVYAE